MMRKEICCPRETDMLDLGARLVKCLTPPAFVALHGDLGAGKTALVHGMGEALGVDTVTSPTFTIVQEYDTKPKLYHFDAYRLSDADELYAIGFDDYLRENAVLVMEWAELVEEALPQERLELTILGSGAEERTVFAEAKGAVYERILEQL
ncbi:MAG: tRNA (adenosine(37)-N6)-threonylcarbamoyltransferase complex ATPase subunit type 1 TsaE [Eubacteriales bacterium]|nr:tRNA (adenosine(37)-N6)-threonylcarbamoyltransferase complex ATPase subunit type 1 TsaE [Eubacteriales bacterium]